MRKGKPLWFEAKDLGWYEKNGFILSQQDSYPRRRSIQINSAEPDLKWQMRSSVVR